MPNTSRVNAAFAHSRGRSTQWMQKEQMVQKAENIYQLILKESLPTLPLGHQRQVLIQYFCTYSPLWKGYLKKKMVQQVEKPSAMQEMQQTRVRSLDQEGPVEQETAAYSSILNWRIPRTEEPGGLQPQGRKELDLTELAQCTWLICSVVSVFCVQENDPVTQTHVRIYVHIFFFRFFLTIGYYKMLNIVPRAIHNPCLVTISWFSMSVSLSVL